MTKLIYKFIVLFLVLITLSCGINNDDFKQQYDPSVKKTEVALRLNKDLFDTIETNRKNNIHTGDAFEINHVIKEGELLKINLSYGGGCEQHDFEILWDGIIYTDDPCFINLIVTHNGNGDLCEAYLTETIEVDLKVLIGDNIYKNKCGYHIFSPFNSGENSDVFVEGTN